MFVSVGVVDLLLLPTSQRLDCMQAVTAAERRPAEWDLCHKEFYIWDLRSTQLVSAKMWNFEHVFMPKVAAFDHNFSFSAYAIFGKFWADINDFRTPIACKGKKIIKCRSILIVHTLICIVYCTQLLWTLLSGRL